MGDGQTSRRYRKQRLEFRGQGQDNNEPCWLCGMDIDYTLAWPDEQAWELDHLYPRSTHPQHAEDPANFRHSHSLCNNRRSNRMPDADLGEPSEQWFT
ncbi:hypothetical protein [Paenarthrobacter nitroguajacolicus]|uniref:hypothetical protein n=1 Tax=Paenarthrobacter nitroguajacolicus TaxID=211146 RepID=UPI0015BEFF08|nr:hypothetical protein [Paenarthrobacter nitroguajacolicus]NWL34441.1 hypothetical protein [Paenarthrobacter nitroguajacolicus]